MRITAYLLLLLSALMFSCNSNGEDSDPGIGDSPQPDVVGHLLDGGRISAVSLFCLEKGVIYYDNWYNYYLKTKTLKGYENMELIFLIDMNGSTYKSEDTEEMKAIEKLAEKYEKDKSAFIVKDYREKNAVKETVGWPDLLTAYTNGEVSITCDKPLYGEMPGVNLSKHFNISAASQCLAVGSETPYLLYTLGEQLPQTMDGYFPKGVWLQPEYCLEFQSKPSEKYDSLTFYLTVPMLIEGITDNALRQYKGETSGKVLKERVFKAECLIKFDWE